VVKVWNSVSILIVLLLILFLAPAPILLQPLTNIAFAANITNLNRTLPTGVLCPNTTFNVTVNWTITTTGVNNLYLIDYAPAGWNVSGNDSWSTPSGGCKVTANKIEIIWGLIYPNGTVFTAKYRVTVPANATPGSYTFTNGTLGYFVGASGPDPYMENVTGNTTVTVKTVNLTIGSSAGDNVTSPGEGIFGPYCVGTVVNLTATPDVNYAFVNWTGNISTIANSSAANTTITVDNSYSITANFERVISTINGTVYEANCSALAGADIVLSGPESDSTTTNATGYYAFTVDTTGNYTVNVTRSGLTYAVKWANVTALGSNVTCNFTGVDAPYRTAPDGLYCLKCSTLWLYGASYPEGVRP